MSRFNRREFLKGAGALAGASLLPPALQQALAAPAQSGTLGSIAHVVIFSQENRSFDHYFGSMRGVQGFADDHPLLIQGSSNSVFLQKNGTGQIAPWHLDSTVTSGQCVQDISHDWNAMHSSWSRGRLDNWVGAHGSYAMGYLARNDIPWHYALADAFTVCDQFFCSTLSSTNPNRLYMMTGTIDAAGKYGGPVIDNTEPAAGFKWTTYAERLQAAGISWRVYQEQDNYDDNALAWFTNFKNAPAGSPLYVNGMQRRVPADFAADVANDTLPAVSWVIAPAALSEHPYYAPNKGANYVSQYLQALAANPAVWQKTVFILTYDENGGFFDHVLPPIPPAGTADEFVSGTAIGLGQRIPTIVCSPWSTGGYVASEVFDHTSVLQFLEKWTGVAEPNISAWRRQVCGDLTSAFDFTASNTTFATLPDTAALATSADQQCKNLPTPTAPTGTPVLPPQEAGQKPLRVQPYQLACWLTQDLAAGRVWVNWSNAGTKGAALQINADTYRTDGPWNYLAAAGTSGKDYFSAVTYGKGYYDLELHGPGQFFRRFRGYLNAKAVNGQQEPNVTLATNGVGQPVSITFSNSGSQAVSFTVLQRNGDASATRSWTVNVAGGQSVTQQFPTQQDWYDYGITLAGSSVFYQSMAGHVEGAPGVSRPPVQRW